MGNQNKTRQYTEIIQEEDHGVTIDLDDIAEQWIWHTWKKTKVLSRFKREDLLFTINWKHVFFTHENVQFFNSSSSCFPRTLVRSHFENKTTHEQIYNFNSDRSTCAILKVLFTQRLCKSQESTITFQLPKHLIHLSTGFSLEQTIPFGRDVTKEYEMPWNVHSQLRIPPRTRLLANLNVDEEEFSSSFSVKTEFSGRIIVSIAARRSPNVCLKFIAADIVEIISKVKKTNQQLAALEIIDGYSPSVRFTMHGKCTFRYGVKQRIVLNQEALGLSSSCCSELDRIPSAPSEYCNLTTSDNKTDDLIHSYRRDLARI